MLLLFPFDFCYVFSQKRGSSNNIYYCIFQGVECYELNQGLVFTASPGPVYVRKHVRGSKYESPVEEAELIEANPEYAFIRLNTGHETTVSLRDLAPCSDETSQDAVVEDQEEQGPIVEQESNAAHVVHDPSDSSLSSQKNKEPDGPRRSSRRKKEPERFADSKYSGGIACR